MEKEIYSSRESIRPTRGNPVQFIQKDWKQVKNDDGKMWAIVGGASILYIGIFILIVVIFFYGILAMLH